MKKPVEYHLLAAKKRKSEQTGFIHYTYGCLSDERHDAIPLYENFCYALALLRSRMSEQVLEGKALFEKLIAFEVGGNFPVYLHEYPICHNRGLSIDILPVLHWAILDFSAVLGSLFVSILEELISRILIYATQAHIERPFCLTSFVKWKAYTDPTLLCAPDSELTVDQLSHYLIALQMAESKGAQMEDYWNQIRLLWHWDLHLVLKEQSQDQSEPSVTLLDWFFGLDGLSYSDRALVDSPIHLQLSLIHPIPYSHPHLENNRDLNQMCVLNHSPSSQGYQLFWGSSKKLHSLSCDHRLSSMNTEIIPNGSLLQITLPEGWVPSEIAEIPLSFFCNIDDDNTILINQQKATTFQLGDLVTIQSSLQEIHLKFISTDSEGVFFGHILRSNRPLQKSCRGSNRFTAYDWKIAIRTVRRTAQKAVLLVQVNWNLL